MSSRSALNAAQYFSWCFLVSARADVDIPATASMLATSAPIRMCLMVIPPSPKRCKPDARRSAPGEAADRGLDLRGRVAFEEADQPSCRRLDVAEHVAGLDLARADTNGRDRGPMSGRVEGRPRQDEGAREQHAALDELLQSAADGVARRLDAARDPSDIGAR